MNFVVFDSMDFCFDQYSEYIFVHRDAGLLVLYGYSRPEHKFFRLQDLIGDSLSAAESRSLLSKCLLLNDLGSLLVYLYIVLELLALDGVWSPVSSVRWDLDYCRNVFSLMLDAVLKMFYYFFLAGRLSELVWKLQRRLSD